MTPSINKGSKSFWPTRFLKTGRLNIHAKFLPNQFWEATDLNDENNPE